jgi:geranylgeranyl reductase family protein
MIYIRVDPQIDADVVIAGAGPAGAATAYHLASAGMKVALLDQNKFPRDKICGDFVGPAALVELKRIRITSLLEYKASNIIRCAALHLDGEKLIAQTIPEVIGLPSYGRVIPRTLLDDLIVDAAKEAGAQVLEKCRLTDYEEQVDSIKLSVTTPGGPRFLRTRLLIGADGSESTVARLMRGHRPLKDDRIIAVRAYFTGVDGPADQADLYFSGESFPGYYWLFPAGRHTANVGIGMVLETIPPTCDRLRDLLLELVKRDRCLHWRLRNAKLTGGIAGWPLTTYNPHLPIVDSRVMLVGDAAGLINPLNGEGIQYALLSGRWASVAAARCLMHDDLSKGALEAYSSVVHKELNYDMALANLVVQLIRNRNLNPIWLYALRIITSRARIDPEYARIVGGILAGLVPASDAVSLKTISGTIEQAAMSIGLQIFHNVLRGPGNFATLGMSGVRTGFEIGYDTVLHPIDFLKWSFGVGASTVELCAEVASHMIQPRAEAADQITMSVRT